MLFVGIVFMLNTVAAFTKSKVQTKETSLWCTVIGSIIMFLLLFGIVTNLFKGAGTPTLWWAGQVALFGLTYFMMGLNGLVGNDQKGLGWFCGLVAVISIVIIVQACQGGDWRMIAIWVLWAFTWLMFFFELALGKDSWVRWMKWFQIFVLVATLLVPGIMILNGWW
jgi:hypothetical protein